MNGKKTLALLILSIIITSLFTWFSIKVYAAGVEEWTSDDPIDDTHVDQNYPDTNYGTLQYLEIEEDDPEDTWTYIKFNITGFPANDLISSAILYTYLYNEDPDDDGRISCRPVTNDTWSETGITWNDKPSVGAELDDFSFTEEGIWAEWYVTTFIQSEVEAGENFTTFALLPEGYQHQRSQHYSSEYATNSSRRPYLWVEYVVDEVAIITSLSVTNPTPGVGTYTTLYAQGELNYSGHPLGAGDEFYISGAHFTWDWVDSRFEAQVMKETAGAYHYDTLNNITEATYNITNGDINGQNVTVTWLNNTANFYGLYYENGTWEGDVDVTAVLPSTSETFNVNGSLSKGFSEIPIMFYWDIEGGGRRRLYHITNNATYYLFTPEVNYSSYSFDIDDYTGKVGKMNAYLESLRIVNNTEHLIGRMRIQDTVNLVPLTLGKSVTYILQIKFSDGSTYRYGYFIPEIDPTPTLPITRMDFGDQAHTVYQYITAEATRPSGTIIKLDYNDETPSYDTSRVNFTVEYRNGTEAYNDTVENTDTVSFQWESANSTVDYVVRLWADHEYHGEIEQVWVLDASREFDDFPDLDIFGTWGVSTTNFWAILVACVVAGVFSFKSAGIAPFMAMVIIAAFTYLGGASFTNTQIGIGISLSIAWGIVAGGRER